jgi:uncharacterized membrane protein YebE (DUF533 family)
MFDAKSLIETMVRGAAPRQASAGGPDLGALGDLLGQLGRMAGGPAAQAGGPTGGQVGSSGSAGATAGVPGLDDLLRQIAGAAQGGSRPGAAAGGTASGRPAADTSSERYADGGLGGMLGDILGRMQQQPAAPSSRRSDRSRDDDGSAPASGAGGAPDLMDILGQVLGQATSGVREGAGKAGTATGLDETVRRMTGGQGIDEIVAKVKDMVARNQFGAGAAAGGLGAVVLGTRTGRSLAANAAKLGALALIGGLAYKAYTNYSQGKSVLGEGVDTVTEAAPAGSGFEPDAVTNETAILYIRAMIAAAAADGRVDRTEMDAILGNLKQAGLDAAAEEFLAAELNAPASVGDLAAAVASPEQAIQVYTAARIAIAPDSAAETGFLARLAERLGVAPELAAHIDGAARA